MPIFDRKIIFSLIISIAVFFASILALKLSYKVTLFRVNENYYAAIFSIMVFLILFHSSASIRQKTPSSSVVSGVVAGYAAGIISYLAAEALESGGYGNMINTFSRYGVLNLPFALLMFVPALLSFSWLIGGGAFFFMNRLLAKHS